MNSSKGQKIGTQIAIIIIFLSLIVLASWVFKNPETSLKMINGFLREIKSVNWRSWDVKIPIVIAVVILILYLIATRLIDIFEGREVLPGG